MSHGEMRVFVAHSTSQSSVSVSSTAHVIGVDGVHDKAGPGALGRSYGVRGVARSDMATLWSPTFRAVGVSIERLGDVAVVHGVTPRFRAGVVGVRVGVNPHTSSKSLIHGVMGVRTGGAATGEAIIPQAAVGPTQTHLSIALSHDASLSSSLSPPLVRFLRPGVRIGVDASTGPMCTSAYFVMKLQMDSLELSRVRGSGGVGGLGRAEGGDRSRWFQAGPFDAVRR